MLTDKTQKAIGIFHEIAYYGTRSYSDKGAEHACNPSCTAILGQLRKAGFIRLLPEEQPDAVQSYRLCKEFHYGMGASKPGVINQMLCTILRNVNLLDL